MERNYYIKLTLAVYRVTELFPEKEPLKIKIREKANDLLADLLLVSKKNPNFQDKDLIIKLYNDIAVINGFFEIAETQNWVDPRNLLVLKATYAKIKQLLFKNKELSNKAQKKGIDRQIKDKDLKNKNLEPELNERQKKILKTLKEQQNLQVWETKKIFPEVSKRTLRRDFEYLLGQSLIERKGERNNTFYTLAMGRTGN